MKCPKCDAEERKKTIYNHHEHWACGSKRIIGWIGVNFIQSLTCATNEAKAKLHHKATHEMV